MMMMITYLPIDRLGRSVFLHAHHHRVSLVHLFTCLTLPYLILPYTFYSALSAFLRFLLSGVSLCHAVHHRAIRRESDGVVETTSCPFFPSSSSTTFCFPPSRAAFVSPHLFSSIRNGIAVIVFRSLPLFLVV